MSIYWCATVPDSSSEFTVWSGMGAALDIPAAVKHLLKPTAACLPDP